MIVHVVLFVISLACYLALSRCYKKDYRYLVLHKGLATLLVRLVYHKIILKTYIRRYINISLPNDL